MATKKALIAKGHAVTVALAGEYPDAECALHHDGPFQLLAATILSAQCTDERVNMVTPALFRQYPTAAAVARARMEDLEDLIRTTGFFRNKARSLLGMANALVEFHGGDVPRTMGELVRLPGVGRKTANVVLGNCFEEPGITVDTHVRRLSQRIGFTKQEDPVKIERDLMAVIVREEWTNFSHGMIWHGRRVCKARKPACERCVIALHCDYFARHRPKSQG